MLDGFTRTRLKVNGVAINLVYGGSGPPVLLLHGYPQTQSNGTKWRRCWPSDTPS